MTLILSSLSPDMVTLVADRRVTRNGALVDDDTNKIVQGSRSMRRFICLLIAVASVGCSYLRGVSYRIEVSAAALDCVRAFLERRPLAIAEVPHGGSERHYTLKGLSMDRKNPGVVLHWKPEPTTLTVEWVRVNRDWKELQCEQIRTFLGDLYRDMRTSCAALPARLPPSDLWCAKDRVSDATEERLH